MHGTRDELAPLPPPFEVVLRGFDRQQVIDHVNALRTRVATLGAERDVALARAGDLTESLELQRREADEARRQVDRLRREAQDAAAELERLQRSPLTGATARIQQMLQMAEDEAAELVAAAQRETSSLRESVRAETDQLLAETRRRCERLEAASSDQRQRAEDQSERDIASRQAETQAWIGDYQTRSVAALYLLMRLAGERLNNRVATVKRQVSAAKALRSEVTGQLSAVQRMLSEALGVVETPTDAELADQPEQAEQANPAGSTNLAGPPERVERTEPLQPVDQVGPTEHIEPTEHVDPVRHVKRSQQTKLVEPVEPTGPSSGAPSRRPARSAARTRAAQQRERPGAADQSPPPDPPTARFGLHR